MFYKKCVTAADDKDDAENQLFIYNKDNISFDEGETASILGNITLITDETTLSEIFQTDDLCVCFNQNNGIINCADFDEI